MQLGGNRTAGKSVGRDETALLEAAWETGAAALTETTAAVFKHIFYYTHAFVTLLRKSINEVVLVVDVN